MPATALADALPDFGARAAPAVPAPEGAPADDRETAIAEAVARAEAALAERLRDEYEKRLETERERHAGEMEQTLARLGGEAGTAIAERLARLEKEVVAQTGALAARVLGVTLSEDLQRRAVADLAGLIEAALAEPDALRVRVRGNALFCEALRARLGDAAARVDLAEAPGFDVTAEIGESLFETRLGEWSHVLSEVLA